MKKPDRVAELLAELRDLTENDFERHRINVLERDLTSPPTVEIIDDTHQRFNGVTYSKTKTGHYATHSLIHREVWIYSNGEIPDGFQIHHCDFNPSNNSIMNLKPMTHAAHRKLHNGTPIIEKICPACNKPFFVKQTSKQICCSIACANAIKPHKQISYIEKICPICGKNFVVPYELRKQKSCSKTCANKLRSIALKSPVKKICPICKKHFEITKNPKQICCSLSCAAKLRFQKKKSST